MQETPVHFLGLEGLLEKKRASWAECSWAALVVQLVKNLPAMQETWVQSLGWEDPLEKGKATHSSILAWRTPWIVQMLVTKSQTELSDIHFHLALRK